MRNNILTKGVLFFCTLLLLTGCSFLDVSDELAGNLTQEQVFNDPGYARRWHRNIFTGIPDYSNVRVKDITGSENGLINCWTSMSDELNFGDMTEAAYDVQGGYHAGSANFHRWNTLYQLIRQANIFLRDAHTIPAAGSQVDFLNEEELQELRAQARFLRAYYYYLLFELYGPVPLVNDLLSPYEGELDLPRNSADEVVEYICSEMTDLVNEEGGLKDIETTQERLALPTKGVALAVIAKTRILDASPLFNGGFKEALDLTNTDGKRLFSEEDPEKWTVALKAIEQFLTFAEGKYQLFKAYTNSVYDPDKSLYEMFMSYNDEIIWASSKTFFNNLGGWGYDHVCTPYSERQGHQTAAVMQELVDDFFMKDGLTIEESALYKKEGFTKIGGQDIHNKWIDREPRFYQSVFYQGKKWQVSNNPIYFYYGGNNGADKTQNFPATGYLLFKRECRKLYNQGSHPKGQYRPSIIFRLADFYLLYAEVLNEVNPADPKIIEYIDKVRERAGIPLLKTIKPNILGNRNELREAIRRERRIELCTEGQRYFDVRRWMIAEEEGYKQGGDFYGMNMFGPKGDKNAFYEKTYTETRIFEKRMYLYPIPLSQVQISKQMVQNPLWQNELKSFAIQ